MSDTFITKSLSHIVRHFRYSLPIYLAICELCRARVICRYLCCPRSYTKCWRHFFKAWRCLRRPFSWLIFDGRKYRFAVFLQSYFFQFFVCNVFYRLINIFWDSYDKVFVIEIIRETPCLANWFDFSFVRIWQWLRIHCSIISLLGSCLFAVCR